MPTTSATPLYYEACPVQFHISTPVRQRQCEPFTRARVRFCIDARKSQRAVGALIHYAPEVSSERAKLVRRGMMNHALELAARPLPPPFARDESRPYAFT